jgi:hypothetical protein
MEFQKLRLLLKGKTGVFFGYLKTESMLLIKRFHRRYAAGSDNVFVQIASLWNIFMCLDTDLYGKDSAKERHIKGKRFFFFFVCPSALYPYISCCMFAFFPNCPCAPIKLNNKEKHAY